MSRSKKICALCTNNFDPVHTHYSARNVIIGKFGSFLANELIGQPYGLTYEIVDKKLKYLPARTLEEVGRWFNQFSIFLFLEQGLYYCRTEDTDATNELINDGEFVQPLTVDEIQALKRSGVHASVCKDFRSFLHISLS